MENVKKSTHATRKLKRANELSYFKHQRRLAYLFVVPPMILFTIFVILPLIVGGVLSLTDYDVINPPTFVGFENFVRAFSDPFFYKALWNTMRYVIYVVPATIIVQLLSAVLLSRNKRGVGFFRLCFYIPSLTSSVALTMIWRNILNNNGLFNAFLDKLSIVGPNWLASSDWIMLGIAIMTVWGTIGANMLLFIAALQNVPEELYEAAHIDGAGAIRSFFSITLPSIGPTTFLITTTGIIAGLQAFETLMLLNRGGPSWSTTTLTYYIYTMGMSKLEMGYAISMAWLLFVIIAVFVAINKRLSKETSDF